MSKVEEIAKRKLRGRTHWSQVMREVKRFLRKSDQSAAAWCTRETNSKVERPECAGLFLVDTSDCTMQSRSMT